MNQNSQILQLNQNSYEEQVYLNCEMAKILGNVNNVASFALFYRDNANLIDLMRTHLMLDMYESKGISGEHADLGKTLLLKVTQFFQNCAKEFELNQQEQQVIDKEKNDQKN